MVILGVMESMHKCVSFRKLLEVLCHAMFVLEPSMITVWNSLEYFTDAVIKSEWYKNRSSKNVLECYLKVHLESVR